MDLTELSIHLASLPQAPLVIDAADASLPGELRTVLLSAPGKKLSLTPSNAIATSSASLTISGPSKDRWVVPGMPNAVIVISSFSIEITTASISVRARGSLALSPTGVSSVIIKLRQDGAPVWVLALDGAVPGLTASELIELGSAQAPSLTFPDGLSFLDQTLRVDAGGFGIVFANLADETPYFFYSFVVSVAVEWTPVPKLLSFSGLDFALQTTRRSLGAQMIGHLEIGTVPVSICVGLVGNDELYASVLPSKGKAFPSLFDVVQWAFSDLGGSVRSAFTDLEFDGDVSLASIRVAFDWRRRRMTLLEVVGVLTIKSIVLDIVLTLPNAALHGRLRSDTALTARELISSFGFGDGADVVPATMTISAVELSVFLETPTYQLSIVLGSVWSIGPLEVKEVGLIITYMPSMIEADFFGTIALGGINLDVAVEYAGSGLGWSFDGKTQPGETIPVGDLLAALDQRFGIAVPAAISSLVLADVAIGYETATRRFAFTCEGSLTVETLPSSMVVMIALGPRSAGDAARPPDGAAASAENATGVVYEAVYTGSLTIAGLIFDVAFDSVDSGAKTFVATYHHDAASSGAVSLRDLVAALSPALSNEIPVDLEVDLEDVKFVFTKQAGGNAFALGLDLSAKLGLADLPLIGHKLPDAENLGIRDLQLLYASAALASPAIDIAALNALLPAGVSKLPAAGVPAGIRVGATLALGATPQPIGVDAPQPPSTSPPASAPPTMRRAGKYFDVQRQFGPVDIQRVGLLLDSGRLMFALDASMTLGPVGFALEGLAIGSKLDAFSPAFELAGIGVSFTQPGLQILGGLLKLPTAQLKPGVAFQYDGVVVVEAEQLGLAAIGSYAQYDSGAPSLFVYAQLLAPLGGPPAFFVTGLMGGFGFNRALTIPGQDQVAAFPLLALATPPPDKPPPEPLAILDMLEAGPPPPAGGKRVPWIQPRLGEYWLAAGLDFTSFEILSSKALAIVEFGHDLQVALLGTSTLRLPQHSDSAFTYVFVELQIRLVLEPLEGVFAASAILAPNSYVITPDCHLIGGFAFYMWFGASEHAGDLVVTLGGYHPAFKAPTHYPTVPRLGFNWRPSDAVVIQGDAYFALTPSCVMAGGALIVIYQSGDTHAWFTAHADFLVSWRPFSYSADIDVSIGVSYRLDLLFSSVSVSVSVSAAVKLWGPPTGGTARIDLSVISFSVDFGSDKVAANDAPLDWTQFKTLLPKDDHICRIAITDGLYKAQDDPGQASLKLWIVRTTRLSFTTRSAIPASQLVINGKAEPSPASGGISIKPMNRASVRSAHVVIIRGEDGTAADLATWSVTAHAAKVPETLWGVPYTPFSQKPSGPTAKVVDAVLGYNIVAPTPVLGRSRGFVALGVFAEEPVATGASPIDASARPSEAFTPVRDATTIGAIATCAAAQVAQARSRLVDALRKAGLYTGEDAGMTRLATAAQDLFSAPPMRCS